MPLLFLVACISEWQSQGPNLQTFVYILTFILTQDRLISFLISILRSDLRTGYRIYTDW